jgi:hypothetical protein
LNEIGWDMDYDLSGTPFEYWEIDKKAKGGKVSILTNAQIAKHLMSDQYSYGEFIQEYLEDYLNKHKDKAIYWDAWFRGAEGRDLEDADKGIVFKGKTKFRKGGVTKGSTLPKGTKYVPNRDISKVIFVVDGKEREVLGTEILDGIYIDASVAKLIYEEPKKKAEPKTRQYKLGDRWRSDFDYEGMFRYGLKKSLTENSALSTLNKLFESFQDVNEHTVGAPLWDAIVELKKGNKAEAKKHMAKFKKLVQAEVDEGGFESFEKGGKVGEKEFEAIYNSKKISIMAESLYGAKQKAIKELKVPKSKQGLLSVYSIESKEKGDFMFMQKGGRIDSKAKYHADKKYFIGDEGMFKGGEFRIKSHQSFPNRYEIIELDEEGNEKGKSTTINQKDFESYFTKFEKGGKVEGVDIVGMKFESQWHDDYGKSIKSPSEIKKAIKESEWVVFYDKYGNPFSREDLSIRNTSVFGEKVNVVKMAKGGKIKVGDTVYPESLAGKHTVVEILDKKDSRGKVFMGDVYYDVILENEDGKRVKYPSNRFEKGGEIASGLDSESVWNSWSSGQRFTFLEDNRNQIYGSANMGSRNSISVALNPYTKLGTNVKTELTKVLDSGKFYKCGGKV